MRSVLNQLEEVECPLCHVAPKPFAVDYQGFQLCSCPSCGLQFLSPRPTVEQLTENIYNETYFSECERTKELSAADRYQFSRQLENFERFLAGRGTILDVGCGDCSFLHYAQSEGWQVAGITTFSSGLPFDIFTATDTAHTGQPQRPDFNPAGIPVPVSNPRTQTGPNLGLFTDAPFGRGGDLGRNHFRGPGINNWDVVLQKTTSLSERLSVEFRTEFYNLFNRVQFSQPGNLRSNPGTFGQSTSEVRRADQTSGARQIQFGMKLRF